MLAAPDLPSSYQNGASFRSRATSFLIAFAICALMVWLLIRLGVLPPIVKQETVTLKLLAEQNASAAAGSHTIDKKQHASRGKVRPTPAVKPAASKPVQTPPHPPIPWMVTPLSHEEFAASDISKLPSHAGEGAPSGQSADGSGSGADSGSTYGPGEGPGGEQLFNAEWYVKPPQSALAFYLPPGASPVGYGMIACKTIPDYRVEDCRELGETPGSGLARALRQAAWQFRVRPPRKGGRPIIGAWVRIRWDQLRPGESTSDGAG